MSTSSTIGASWHPADVPGLPTYAAYKLLEAHNVCDALYFAHRKKTVIARALFDRLRDVLDPGASRTGETETDVRLLHWARTCFKLDVPPPRRAGNHNHNHNHDHDQQAPDAVTLLSAGGLAVAVREQLYALLCDFHQRTRHGGPEKTHRAIRERYAYVPRALVLAFVKACPTCTAAAAAAGGGRSRTRDSGKLKFVHWQPFLGGALPASSYTLQASKRMPVHRTIQLRPPPPSTLRAEHPSTPPSNTPPAPLPLLLPSLRYHPNLNMAPSSAPRPTTRVRSRKSSDASHVTASDAPGPAPPSATCPLASNASSTHTHRGGLPKGWEIILRPVESESRGSASSAMGREQGRSSPARAHPYKSGGGHGGW